LSEPVAGIAELLHEHPGIDQPTLRKLLEKAEREKAEQRSPVAARELFAFLRQLFT
jgi:ribosome-associated protein